MLELNAGNYQLWYNIVVLALIAGLAVWAWLHTFRNKWLEIWSEIIIACWGIYSIAVTLHHLTGFPRIH